jgi:hypothetical protein
LDTAIHDERRSVEAEIRSLKEQLRSTWTRPMAPEQVRLDLLKKWATAIYMTLAHEHGRVHCEPPAHYWRHWFGYRLGSEAVEADVAFMVKETLEQRFEKG